MSEEEVYPAVHETMCERYLLGRWIVHELVAPMQRYDDYIYMFTKGLDLRTHEFCAGRWPGWRIQKILLRTQIEIEKPKTDPVADHDVGRL